MELTLLSGTPVGLRLRVIGNPRTQIVKNIIQKIISTTSCSHLVSSPVNLINTLLDQNLVVATTDVSGFALKIVADADIDRYVSTFQRESGCRGSHLVSVLASREVINDRVWIVSTLGL